MRNRQRDEQYNPSGLEMSIDLKSLRSLPDPSLCRLRNRFSVLLAFSRRHLRPEEFARLLGGTPCGGRIVRHRSQYSCVEGFRRGIPVLLDDRDKVRWRLHHEGVQTQAHYPTPLHLQPTLAGLDYEPGEFLNADRACSHALILPVSRN